MKSLPPDKLLFLILAVGSIMGQTASALISIDSVHVGDIGNPNDPTTGYGAVNYGYSIGKYEVTLNQYTAFLNAVGATDTYGLYHPAMGSDLNVSGISRSGGSGSYTYSVIGRGDRPITYVSWYDAARFVNWLHNGQLIGGQVPSTTEQGAYDLNGVTAAGIFSRNAYWNYGLPSENEWYKAAYYQPMTQGGDTDNYWLYPTGNNAAPNSRNGSGSDPNSANFRRDDGLANGFNGGFAVTDSTIHSSSQNYLTAAGSFSLAESFYGTFDQGGNVSEWNDAIIGGIRGIRGGAWNNLESNMRASNQDANNAPHVEYSNVGFRVVIVPEPSVITFAIVGTALSLWRRRND